MRKSKRYVIVYLFTFPMDLLTWLSVLFLWICWGTKLQWVSYSGLWCELKVNSWPTKSWYRVPFREGIAKIRPITEWEQYGKWYTWAGTTLGHGGFFGPGQSGGDGIDTDVEVHENVHVEQFEVSMVTSFIMGLLVFGVLLFGGHMQVGIVLGGTLWILGFILMCMGGWLVGFLQGEGAYRGSVHEEGAYAIAAEYARKKNGLD